MPNTRGKELTGTLVNMIKGELLTSTTKVFDAVTGEAAELDMADIREQLAAIDNLGDVDEKAKALENLFVFKGINFEDNDSRFGYTINFTTGTDDSKLYELRGVNLDKLFTDAGNTEHVISQKVSTIKNSFTGDYGYTILSDGTELSIERNTTKIGGEDGAVAVEYTMDDGSKYSSLYELVGEVHKREYTNQVGLANNVGRITGKDGKFLTYNTLEEGVQALFGDVRTKVSGNSINKIPDPTKPEDQWERLSSNSTLHDFFKVYAPKGHAGNNPEVYAKNVATLINGELQGKGLSISVDMNTPLSTFIGREWLIVYGIANQEGSELSEIAKQMIKLKILEY